MNKQYLMGSNYFFKDFDDFCPHDIDYLILEENPILYKTEMSIRGNNIDYIYWKKFNAEEFINITLDSNTPMQLGKFLIPEIVEELGITIELLKLLKPLTEVLDDKHKYEKVIFDAYIENNEFKLNKEQLEKAYSVYKKERKN